MNEAIKQFGIKATTGRIFVVEGVALKRQVRFVETVAESLQSAVGEYRFKYRFIAGSSGRN